MFGSNKSKETSKTTTPVVSPSNSFNSLVQGTRVEGDIRSKNDIRIDGSVKGSLECESKVIIGSTGSAEGEVTCKFAVIEGRFQGTLVVEDLLTIKETANVNGHIRYGKLVVQPGAVLVGDLRMNGASPNAKPAAEASKTPGNVQQPQKETTS